MNDPAYSDNFQAKFSEVSKSNPTCTKQNVNVKWQIDSFDIDPRFM